MKGLHALTKGATQLLALCCISTLDFVPVGSERALEAPMQLSSSRYRHLRLVGMVSPTGNKRQNILVDILYLYNDLLKWHV